MARFKTALGRTLDMTSLAAKNERVRAVGNMSVNARGDTIDSNGKVIVPVTKKTSEEYQKNVKNKSAQLKENPNIAKTKPILINEPPIVGDEELTKEERELEESMRDDAEVEKIKSKELANKND